DGKRIEPRLFGQCERARALFGCLSDSRFEPRRIAPSSGRLASVCRRSQCSRGSSVQRPWTKSGISWNQVASVGFAKLNARSASIIRAPSIARLFRVTCDNRNVLAARAAALSRANFRESSQHLQVARSSRIPRRQTGRGLDRTAADYALENSGENAWQ